jgi:hypothetical protein
MEKTKWLLSKLESIFCSRSLTLKKKFNNRKKQSREEFLKEAVNKGYRYELGAVIYDLIIALLPKNLSNINIYFEDNVVEDFEIDDEDIGDILIDFFNKVNVSFPTIDDQNSFYKKKGSNVTVERLLQFLEEFIPGGSVPN